MDLPKRNSVLTHHIETCSKHLKDLKLIFCLHMHFRHSLQAILHSLYFNKSFLILFIFFSFVCF